MPAIKPSKRYYALALQAQDRNRIAMLATAGAWTAAIEGIETALARGEDVSGGAFAKRLSSFRDALLEDLFGEAEEVTH